MFKLYRSVLAAGVVALGLAACGDNVTVTNPPPVTPVVHGVTVVPQSATVTVGQAGVTFVASVNADSGLAKTVTWTSTNATVATVGSTTGVITALAPGQATIVATSDGDHSVTGAGSLTVVAPVPNISAFTVTPTNASISVGGTLQANSSVTVANGAPAATVTWATSNVNIASVGASTGTITGVSAGTAVITATATSGSQTQTATIGVTVGSGPAGVISFSISPSAATLFAGQTQQITSTITVAPTFTAPPVTWSSLAPTVATVSSTGLVTAQAQGTAVITATIGTSPNTITQTALITVGQSATISIANVSAGATAGAIPNCAGVNGSPVLLADVNCQIEVYLNLNAGTQRVDSVTVWFIQGATTHKLARQFYGGTIPAAGVIDLQVNTANFSKNVAKGTAMVDLWNGPTTMVAQVWPSLGGSSSATNCQIGAGNADPTCSNLSMVLNNTDGWAADLTKCGTTISTATICPAAVPAVGAGVNASTGGFAVDVNGSSINAGKTYWGGPGPTGDITAELYAVVYNDNPANTPGSSLNRCNNQVGDGTGCISSVNWTIGSTAVSFGHCNYMPQSATVAPATPLFRQVFGSTAAVVTNDCSGHENLLNRRDNILIASGALDAQNNNYPTGPLIPNTVVNGATPDSFRLDWNGPSNVQRPTGEGWEGQHWVNANWQFNHDGTAVTDAGVGPAGSTWTAFVSPGYTTVIHSGADLPETNTNTSDGYNALALATDLLGNVSSSAVNTTFGVDKTSPLLRYSIVAAPSTFASAYVSGGATATSLDSLTYAAFEGIYGANVVTAGQQTLFLAAAAGTNDSVRVDALDGRSGLSRFVENTVRFSQNGANGAVSSIYSTTGGFIGTGLIDGWQVSPALHVTNGRVPTAPPVNPGYYTTTEYVIDNAGNVSGCPAVGVVGSVANPPIQISGSFCAGATAGAIAPSTTAFSNPAMVGGQPGTNANLFVRRTLAIDPGQPIVTGVSPNAVYHGNQAATFTLGAQNDLEVIDARLRIQYPNLSTGAAAVVASPGLIWSYALSNTFMASGNRAGPASGTGVNFGYFAPIGIRFDGAVNAFPGNGLGIVDPRLVPLTLDMFTLDVQETCLGAASPTANCAVNGDPIPQVDVDYTSKPVVTPTNVAVQVRDVFGSWIFNTLASATTGVSAEFVSPLLPNSVDAPNGYSVSYYNAGALTSCPQGGVVQLANTTSCVSTGVNFRAEPTLSSASVKVFRSTESFSTTLPIFTRVDLFGLNAAGEWVFIQRCTVPPTIIPNSGSQACAQQIVPPLPALPFFAGTVAGTDNGNERYWIYTFSAVASAGFTQFRALGVNSAGYGLFSTRQP